MKKITWFFVAALLVAGCTLYYNHAQSVEAATVQAQNDAFNAYSVCVAQVNSEYNQEYSSQLLDVMIFQPDSITTMINNKQAALDACGQN
jgi:Prokaryotic membrane lipoprotein lipid attachment site